LSSSTKGLAIMYIDLLPAFFLLKLHFGHLVAAVDISITQTRTPGGGKGEE
jgi:hypothetical protein